MSQKWHDKTSFKDTNKKIIDYAKKLRADDNIKLDLECPVLNFCYINYDDSILQKIQQGKFKSSPVTTIYETRKDQSIENIEKRKSVLKLLSIANKAHFFLFESKDVWGTPYYIEYPNFINPQKNDSLYELIYPLYKDVIIVASEWASENKTIQAPENFYKFIRFPVAVSKNSMQWLRLSEWKKYKNQIAHNNNSEQFGSAYYKTINLNNKNELEEYKKNAAYLVEITDKNRFKYKQKEHICKSCNGTKITLKTNQEFRAFYYWPKGWDDKMLQEYIEYYLHAIIENDKQKQKQIPPIVDWIGLP